MLSDLISPGALWLVPLERGIFLPSVWSLLRGELQLVHFRRGWQSFHGHGSLSGLGVLVLSLATMIMDILSDYSELWRGGGSGQCSQTRPATQDLLWGWRIWVLEGNGALQRHHRKSPPVWWSVFLLHHFSSDLLWRPPRHPGWLSK